MGYRAWLQEKGKILIINTSLRKNKLSVLNHELAEKLDTFK